MIKRLGAIAACAAALMAPAGAAASVSLVNLTSPVQAGSAALLVARVTGASHPCSISVRSKRGLSHAAGLTPKRPSAGIVSWAWNVGTIRGRWQIAVSCGAAGRLTATLVVS